MRATNIIMNDFIRLTCPACGGRLEIGNTITQFVCAHCGTEHVVNRGGGVISLQPLAEGLHRIQRGTDFTAAELAIGRLRTELSDLKVTQGLCQERLQETFGRMTELTKRKKEFKTTKRTRLLFALGFFIVGAVLIFMGWSIQQIQNPICVGPAVLGFGVAALLLWQSFNVKVHGQQEYQFDAAMEAQHDVVENIQQELNRLRQEIANVTKKLDDNLDIVRG